MLRITPDTTVDDLRTALRLLAVQPGSPVRTTHTDPLLDALHERLAFIPAE